MKHLQDYILETTQVNESEEEKKIVFDFSDLENAEETLKSLEGKEGVSIDGQTLTLTINADNVKKLDTVQDILQQFCQTIRTSQKRSSDEQYAQKTKSFEEKVADMNDAIDEIENPEEGE